jgi:hypothetical protein
LLDLEPTQTVSSRLDPEEALAGPLYVVAALLIVIPLVDFVLSVPPAELSNVQWRFAAVGLLSGYTLTPIMGLAMAFVVSAFVKHHALQRWLVVGCLAFGTILTALSAGFLLDMLQLRFSVPNDGRAAFRSASTRAIVKLGLSVIALMYLGWRARRMIPARSRERPSKTVHVVSK